MSPHPFLRRSTPLAVAHRGGTEAAPENSVAAFSAAVSVGFTHLETDVHLSADGVLVAFHDDVLDRVTDGSGAISEMTWDQIGSVRIGAAEPIPRLEELLEAFPDAWFNVDPKADDSVVALVRVLRQQRAVERVCIGAFSDRRLRRMRELAGASLCTSAGPREIAALTAAARLGRGAGLLGGAYQCVQVPVRHKGVEIVTPAFISAAHDSGKPVHVWTIDDPTEMHRLLDMGVDGIMTDRPSTLRSVLEERGEWQ
ncbi:MAG: glycerophosphodiester phosphodiesterase [Microthrixaceae bacterium]